MASKCEEPVLNFKRGDDLKLDFTIQDTNNKVAQAAATALVKAQQTLSDAQKADPVVVQDVTDATALVATNQAAYDAAIIVNITGWTIRSMVDRSGKKIQDLIITVLDPSEGTFVLSASSTDTVDWPVTKLACDIEFTRPQGVVSSETLYINVIRDVTKP